MMQPRTLAELFFAQVAQVPANIALRSGANTLTYEQLECEARRLASLLQSQGVGPGQLVGICGARSVDYIVAILATAIAGGAYLPIDPSLPQQRIDLMLADAGPVLVLADEDARARLVFTSAIGLEAESWKQLVPANASLAPVTVTPDDLIYVMYTSGSTGTPKGVCIAQRGVIRLVHGATYATFGPQTAILQISTLTFDAATFEIWGSLINGGCCVLMPYAKPSLNQIEEILTSGNVTTVFLTTALFAEIVDRQPLAFRQIREVLTGGEAIPPSAVKRALTLNPSLNVIACYGPTECTTFTTTHRYASPAEVGTIIPLGEPIAETQVHCLRDDLSPTAPGEEGELYVAGAGLATGYLNRPELTAQAFVETSFAARLYRTGDRCVLNEAGEILFRGRQDGQIKLRGFRIEMGEIESAVRDHPAVHSVLAKTEQTATGDRVVVAYVVPTTEALKADAARDQAIFDERTEQWQLVYNQLLYKSLASADQAGDDPTFNTSGWKSSFDGRPISLEEMEDHVGCAIDRILSLKPRRVLEIGCGTGMLLFRLAPHCESYKATDFSPAVLQYVDKQLRQMPWLTNVKLSQSLAHELPAAPEGGFDLVILNSVTEHFASVEYLNDLLQSLPAVLSDSGRVFVGDNRNHTLLPHFRASIQLANSPDDVPLSKFRILAEQFADDEEQLTINPYFFLQAASTQYARVSLQNRRGRHSNELTGYRYDAILEKGTPQPVAQTVESRRWHAASDSLDAVRSQLLVDAPTQFILQRIPNARLRGADVLIDAIGATGAEIPSTGDLRRVVTSAPAGEDPEHFWQLAAELHYDVLLYASPGDLTGAFDVVFRKNSAEPFDLRQLYPVTENRPLASFGNDPLRGWRKERLASDLRKFLEHSLPEYAVPSFFAVLPRFPLNANGKIALAALPLPARIRAAVAAGPTSDQNDTEGCVRMTWESVLGVRNIAPDERFFDLGGDSLKAVRAASDLSRIFQFDVSPALLFEEPSLRGFSRLLDQKRQGDAPIPAPDAPQRGKQRRAAASGSNRQLTTV